MDYYVSDSGRYCLAIKTGPDSKTGIASLMNAGGQVIVSGTETSYETGGCRAAVSNNGELFATAAYSHKGIDIRDSAGALVCSIGSVKKIQGLCFDKHDEFLYVWNGDEPPHTYYVNIGDTSGIKRVVADKVLDDAFGDKILFYRQNVVIINGIKIKAPTFAFLTAVGTPEGIVLSPVSDDPVMYDRKGCLKWISDIFDRVERDNIVQLVYDSGLVTALSAHGNVYRLDACDGKLIEVIGGGAKCLLENGRSRILYDGSIDKL